MAQAFTDDGKPQKFKQTIVGCARCWGDGHEDLVFRPFTHPVESREGVEVYTHWSICPTSGEPILMEFFDVGS